MAEDEIYDVRMEEHVYTHESTYLALVRNLYEGKIIHRQERKKGVKAKKELSFHKHISYKTSKYAMYLRKEHP